MCFMEMTGLTVALSSNYQHLVHKSAFVEMMASAAESVCRMGGGVAPGADRYTCCALTCDSVPTVGRQPEDGPASPSRRRLSLERRAAERRTALIWDYLTLPLHQICSLGNRMGVHLHESRKWWLSVPLPPAPPKS